MIHVGNRHAGRHVLVLTTDDALAPASTYIDPGRHVTGYSTSGRR
jgi:hypothetical protein